MENGVLPIEGEHRQEKKGENERVHRLERSVGRFSRSFSLPDDAAAAAPAVQVPVE